MVDVVAFCLHFLLQELLFLLDVLVVLPVAQCLARAGVAGQQVDSPPPLSVERIPDKSSVESVAR